MDKLIRDKLVIAKKKFNSRLIVGTGKYRNMIECAKAIKLSGAEIVTVAVRRVNITDKKKPLLMDYIDPKKITYLPNTAGCFNAKEALRGVQLPIGDFRGSGLAWMVDILSGVFTGGNHGGKVKDPFDDFTGPQNIGHLFIVIKPNLFVGNYDQRIKENIKRVKRLPKIKGVKDILYPGQNRFLRFQKNLKKTIKIPKNIREDLKKLNA